MDIIADFESGSYSKTALTTKHGVPKSSLTRILHDKDKLQDAFETSRFGQNLPFCGPIIAAKTREFATKMALGKFSASDRWLSRFKERHGLTFKTVCGEMLTEPNAKNGSLGI
ncbi:hypothetical protein HPB50_013922 [Hyalomma asiaticum]|uniref:Uncharacterized protein n=1 Tax=Hyalomma asiaticum TaxID=266040 RepID=A0ACB7SEH0_HYAAI|nr:hypothetical protein HPB50_013922 [Hyalomma asiaticum]